ncbi:histidine-rich glycoprotein [Nilaparvata lugens]|uniref:histidine-rich glycoprotein n=1 Tax=Nilaparvata lugens TaxID=108931 RepID=UPI000B98B038|nr:histidine-rich glycoprotein [Nilaparvata lugens]
MMKIITVCICVMLISAAMAAPPRQVKRSPVAKPHSSEEFYSWGEHRPHYGHYGHYDHHGPFGYHEHYHGHGHGYHDGFYPNYYGGHHGHSPGLGFGIGFHF